MKDATTGLAEASDHSPKRRSTEKTILDAAASCFRSVGIRGTTMDDVANRAEISRATLYRYFANKNAIIDRISEIEIERVQTEMRSLLDKNAPVTSTISECLLLATRIAQKNPVIRALIEGNNVSSLLSERKSAQYQAFISAWRTLIDRAIDEKEGEHSLTRNSVADWLSLSIQLLFVKVEATDVSDAELREFIDQFVVLPLRPDV